MSDNINFKVISIRAESYKELKRIAQAEGNKLGINLSLAAAVDIILERVKQLK